MKPPQPDPYWEVVKKQYDHILYLYRQFADKRPVMLYNIQEQRIYAYPYREFAADLSERSQKSLAREYAAAVRNGQMVVFVRDNVKRRLVSCSVPCGRPTPAAASNDRARAPRGAKPPPKPVAGVRTTRAGQSRASKRKSP